MTSDRTGQALAEAASPPATILDEIRRRFPEGNFVPQETKDPIPTVWVDREKLLPLLRFLKEEAPGPYRMLFDLTAIDERSRNRREGQPASDFTAVYHLLSFDRNADIRLKVPLKEGALSVPSITSIWPSANWYEREAWDMFGIRYEGHPNLRRILMPPTWNGHPLRKDHPARATEMGPYQLPDQKEEVEEEALRFRPEEWGLRRTRDGTDFMFLNIGPQHPGTHGVLRIVLQLDGEEIIDAVPDIGFHHRAAEKMGERQTWHTYIPYTDRVDYLSGVVNNLTYLSSVERLAGIEIPDRAVYLRVLMAELFRVANHLVWFGTFVQDVGQMSPVFYMFNDREKLFEIVEAVTGARMHPSWFRIGGTAADLPKGADTMIRDFLDFMPRRIDMYEKMCMENRIFQARTKGIGKLSLSEAIEWGVSGPNLRACGLPWDLRKKRPYAGYDRFQFEVPTATEGDCFARAQVRIEEMRQSLRIVRQCLDGLPAGSYKALHPRTTPPIKDRTMHDIETLITHFLNVTWGPVIPPGEAAIINEASKGMSVYYLVSDGSTCSYRTRIRSPSFAHLQILGLLSRGLMIPDLLAILGSMDYVLADVDR